MNKKCTINDGENCISDEKLRKIKYIVAGK
jgi:hypothetical protein